MKNSKTSDHLSQFVEKMKNEDLKPIVIEAFSYYYQQVLSGHTGMIYNHEITPVDPDEIESLDQLKKYAQTGQKAFSKAVMIVLNGGLGTSMGLTGPKSLIEVKNGKTFLDIILNHAGLKGVRVVLMNSFNTHSATIQKLSILNPPNAPLTFKQHKFPKILQENYAPASWPANPDLEWNPPGHGDIYSALITSEMMDHLIKNDIEYAFISNCDNLGASMDESLLGCFVENDLPFMMEVAERTPADVKGGHLARYQDGRLLIRESAQCPEEELDAFRDIERYRFFNTNNLWVNLKAVRRQIESKGFFKLPLILNPKTLDPRDKSTPPVYQVETAMGSAVSFFEGARAVKIPRSRFFPIKKCNDLLALQSDCFILNEKEVLIENPERQLPDRVQVRLDPDYYTKIDMYNERFKEGAPSLIDCESLTVEGDVRFGKGVTIKGKVTIRNRKSEQALIESGQTIENDVVFS